MMATDMYLSIAGVTDNKEAGKQFHRPDGAYPGFQLWRYEFDGAR